MKHLLSSGGPFLEVAAEETLLRSFLLSREIARNARRAVDFKCGQLDSFDVTEESGVRSCRVTKAPAG